ncbi:MULTISPECIES: DUF3800 domain-containing protein [Stenotrophomonas]|uniref:DUF3800 domain-containing protein n=1 Tax=Stenotrophomonas TaxID=40323 RepID=UPI0013FD01DD|nr:DUF3800 domain-containing protein [Stenotrophomonas nematodicola]
MFSDYMLFIDESGDHGLDSIDRHYPVFVLCGVLVEKDEYVGTLSPALSRLKLKHWGHTEVILHEREIRKPSGPFSFLQIAEQRDAFHQEVAEIFHQGEFQLIYSVIHKERYIQRYAAPRNPYELSMSFVLERAFLELNERGHGARRTTVIVECRGRKEDAQLKVAFEQIVSGNNACRRALPFDLLMVPKSANSAGLQIADLAARPLGAHVLRPEQQSRAYGAIRARIRRSPTGAVRGFGVKVSP